MIPIFFMYDNCMTITFENESRRGMGQYKRDGGGGGKISV